MTYVLHPHGAGPSSIKVQNNMSSGLSSAPALLSLSTVKEVSSSDAPYMGGDL